MRLISIAAALGLGFGESVCGQDGLVCAARDVVGRFVDPFNVRDVSIQGALAFVCGSNPTLQVLDVSDPTRPEVIGSNFDGAIGIGVDVAATTAAVVTTNELLVFDVAAPDAPLVVSSIPLPRQGCSLARSGDLLLVGHHDGLLIVDLGDPLNPRELANLLTSGRVCGISAVGNRAYLATGNSGLQIIDLSSPDEPVLIGTYESSDARCVEVDGSLAYIGSCEAVEVLDVSDANDVALLGSVELPFCASNDIELDGSTAIVDGGQFLIDVGDPQAPQLIGSYPHEGFTACAAESLVFAAALEGLLVIDMTSPVESGLLGSEPPLDWMEAVAVEGPTAIVAEDDAGVRVFDVSDKRDPLQVATIGIGTPAYDVAMRDELAYATGYLTGFSVFDLSSPHEPELLGSLDGVVGGRIAIDGDIACTLTSNCRFIDISLPAEPTLLAEHSLSGGRQPSGVAADRGIAYIAKGSLYIFDLATPSEPPIAELSLRATCVAVADGVAYLGTEDALVAVDVTDPSGPSVIGQMPLPQNGSRDVPTSISVWGNAVFVAVETGSFWVIDVSDASAPSLLTTASGWRPAGELSDLDTDSDSLYVVHPELGLHILDISDCPPCPADWNDDGTIDTRDFVAFLGDWAAGDEAADLTGDGVVDTRDFVEFLGLWAADC